MTATNASPDSLLPLDGIDEPGFPDFRFEEHYWKQGLRHVAGVDEAGRGPLAGPVVAAAVILSPDRVPSGLNDSKKLTARKRERLHGEIMDAALAVSVASLSAESIDAGNILRASLEAMRRAIAALAIRAECALVDGRDVPPGLTLAAPPRAIIRGDGRSLSIAAASVVAKVTRDRMMAGLGPHHPQYGLERHMGYGSKAHREAIGIHGGIRRVHRFTFAPLK
ncbi:ribonuclease HII [Oricola thermophila]|uniref:Ribonuclease HII n=1 Tax=Oricola thermophila TaxID=2742145 RepID=A0A6N1VEI9_9HYPH|nr:ribonuclease HII [Oricola thermophila]QKV18933.1 ribonuclease HII [Oricola thermophila]